MPDSTLAIPTVWLDWLAVCGYVAFAIFIAWRIMAPKSR
jgi:hypothetical protein